MNESEKKIVEVHLEDIIPNPFQPRLAFNEDKIQELADSIKIHGVIEPLILRRNGDKYEIIAGERRYKASTMAGLATVPAIVTDWDNNKSAEIALVENLQRKNLTAIEEARSFQKLQDRGYSQDDIAKKMGISQSSIANKIRLLGLADEAQRALLEEKISERHARSLLTLDKLKQVEMLNRIINERLTVKQLEEEISKLSQDNNQSVQQVPSSSEQKNPFIDIDELMSNAVSTPSIINPTDLEIFDIPAINPTELPVKPTELTIESVEIMPDVEIDPTVKTENLTYPEPVFNKVQEEKQQVIQKNTIIITKEDFSTVIRSFDKLKKDIEEAGLQISMETFNFDEYYQLIIKVYKNQ